MCFQESDILAALAQGHPRNVFVFVSKLVQQFLARRFLKIYIDTKKCPNSQKWLAPFNRNDSIINKYFTIYRENQPRILVAMHFDKSGMFQVKFISSDVGVSGASGGCFRCSCSLCDLLSTLNSTPIVKGYLELSRTIIIALLNKLNIFIFKVTRHMVMYRTLNGSPRCFLA